MKSSLVTTIIRSVPWLYKKPGKETAKVWKLLCCLLFCNSTNAQTNLVPNSSFENYTICPSNSGRPLPAPWYSPTALIYRNNQYLNSCSSNLYYSVPSNYWGFQNAHSGNAYVNVVTLSLQLQNSDRYYVQTTLLDSLKKDKSYYVEFYVSLQSAVRYGSNNTSLLFSKKAQFVDTINDPFGVLQANAQIVGYGNPIITDTLNWVKISGIYKAQGGEQFITIGNFKNDNQTSFTQLNSIQQNCICATYYLDDVSVIPLDSFCLKADAGKDITIQQGDSAFIGSYTNGIDSLLWLENGSTKKDSTRPGFYVHPNSNTFYVLRQIVNGCFSSDTIFVNVLLPLKFINYNTVSSLRGTKQSVENLWTTANEINVSHFNIQRSTNGRDFIIIGKVAANNKSYNEYKFIDDGQQSTVDGGLYYRIESVDFDGRKQYSTTQQINTKHQTPNIVLYPNPTKDVVTIECKGMKEFSIVNCLGVEISRQEPRNDVAVVNVKGFDKGLYIVKVVTANGATVISKFVKE